MILIDFPEPVSGQAFLRVTGHAGNAEKGFDIVCAGVSTLVQTFAGGVEKCFSAEIAGVFEPGNCDLTVKVPDGLQKELRNLCEVFKFGFRKIEQSYPEHVKLN